MGKDFQISNEKHSYRIVFNDGETPDTLEDFKFNDTDLKEDFYEDFYAEVGSESPLKAVREFQFGEVVKRLRQIHRANQAESSFIDIGAANGDFVEFLRKSFPQNKVLGVEPCAEKETEYLKKKCIEDVTENYDFVFLMDVFEHFQDPREKMQLLHKIVSDEGYICLKVPNKDSLLYRLGKISRFFLRFMANKLFWRLYQVDFPPPHFYYHNKNALLGAMREHFEPVDIFYLSEVPVSGMMKRLWGLNPILKMILLPLVVIYNMATIGRLKDGLVIIGKKKTTLLNPPISKAV